MFNVVFYDFFDEWKKRKKFLKEILKFGGKKQ